MLQLIVEPTKNALRRSTLIVLREMRRESQRRKVPFVKRLRKKTARVSIDRRLHDQNAGKRRRLYLHATSLASARRYAPYSLFPSWPARRSSCSRSTKPMRYATSSGDAIFNP